MQTEITEGKKMKAFLNILVNGRELNLLNDDAVKELKVDGISRALREVFKEFESVIGVPPTAIYVSGSVRSLVREFLNKHLVKQIMSWSSDEFDFDGVEVHSSCRISSDHECTMVLWK